MEEELGLEIGFVSENGAFSCSRDCARNAAALSARAIDQDEYEALIESGKLLAEAHCPGCGAEFAVAWPDGEP